MTNTNQGPDPVAHAAYLELPGKPGHAPDCECWMCAQHRHTWDLAIKRGTWTRERVIEHGKKQAADRQGEPGGDGAAGAGGAGSGRDDERVRPKSGKRKDPDGGVFD